MELQLNKKNHAHYHYNLQHAEQQAELTEIPILLKKKQEAVSRDMLQFVRTRDTLTSMPGNMLGIPI